MDWNTADLNSWPAKLVSRVGNKLRSSKTFTQESIAKNNAREADRRRRREIEYARRNHWDIPRQSHDTGRISMSSTKQGDHVNELGEREYSVFSDGSTLVERPDHTDMLHRLAHYGSFDSLVDQTVEHRLKDPYFDSRNPHNDLLRRSTKHETMIETLPEEIWQTIAGYLNAADAANLSISSLTLRRKLGAEHLQALDRLENKHFKTAFLLSMDNRLPDHLLCFVCNRYHLRTNPGSETLKIHYVTNPVYLCPNIKTSVLPRMRLTQGRQLPYSFVQLALREHFGRGYGISHESLARQWTSESGWNHRTRYLTHDDHLLMRVVSQVHVPPHTSLTKTAERHILYDREEYVPYFSVCAHWRDGLLMDLCKCALSHVPPPPKSYIQQLKEAPKINRALASPNFIVRGCDTCRPARRCPECPTEYLIEVRMVEDPKDSERPFKHDLVVTRWSDLGDGSSPYTSAEWAAVNGLSISEEEGGHAYNSFSHVGRRAVSGMFESRISGTIPGERMLSLNPKNKKMGEDGHGWY
ncbi:hypothetical protein LTR62_005111 [Meristemomyces frigidus]|uniref:F-box domain-containing protein n=1 Tax=Meristemomyces frigidus TaxID=1508187 RepID=A0AAN7THT0_9PEZI|nr:hypothetical protein LTR62_005111 [Meristemomyces frigidus]